MFGVSEDPKRSVTPHIDATDYPATRDEIVAAAADGEAPPEVINLLRNLPQERYERREDVLRDLAEAARRFATGPDRNADKLRDRRNIGRTAAEEKHRHP